MLTPVLFVIVFFWLLQNATITLIVLQVTTMILFPYLYHRYLNIS